MADQQPAAPPPNLGRQTAVHPKTDRGDTVTVACKLPNGLHLDVFDKVEERDAFGRTEERRIRSETRYTLRGFAVDIGKVKGGEMPEYQIVGGAALTPGIPRAHWERWLEENKRNPLVLNHIVFAADTEERARDQAREMREVKSGLEPIVPKSIPTRTGLGQQVQTAAVTEDF